MIVLLRFLLIASALGISGPLMAQGLPVDTGSHLPVRLWFIGSFILAIAIVYCITRNRQRTGDEVRRTKAATEDLYRREDREASPTTTWTTGCPTELYQRRAFAVDGVVVWNNDEPPNTAFRSQQFVSLPNKKLDLDAWAYR